jgi:signal transduction histidine kinase
VNRLASLLPSSLFGRLILVLAVGLVTAQFLGAALSVYERDQALIYYSDHQWAEHDAEVVRLMDTLPPHEEKAIASIRMTPALSVSVLPAHTPIPPQAHPQDHDGRVFEAMLRRLLPGHRIRGYLLRFPVPGLRTRSLFGLGYRTRSIVEVKLRNGRWVAFNFLRPLELHQWPYPLLAYLAVVLGAVILLSYVAVRILTRPLSQLAEAAERLGEDLNRPPLPEDGPTEVSHAAHAFNWMQSRLRRMFDSRTQLITAISHDLRTPITRMRLRAEMLEDETVRRKFIHDLEDMEAMTNGALEYLRGLNGAAAKERLDFASLVETVVLDRIEVGQNIAFKRPKSRIPVLGSPLQLRRVLDNVLDNAFAYGRDPEVSLRCERTHVVCRIRDHGPGIPEDKLPHVLEPYYRLDPARGGSVRNLGLGLSIAQGIVTQHGGHLKLRNAPGGGLEVTLTLPLESGAPSTLPPSATSETSK